MFHLVCFCSFYTITITVTNAFFPPDFAYHYDISSTGTNFTLILLPQLEIQLNVTAYLYIYTAEPLDVVVTMTINWWLQSSPKRTDIRIPAKSMVNLTLASNTGILLHNEVSSIEFINFQSQWTSFGLNVFLHEECVHISAFTALPNNYWGYGYLVSSFRNFLYEIALNIHPNNEITNFCVDPQIVQAYSSERSFDATILNMCQDNETMYDIEVTGVVAENGSREFGLVAYLFPIAVTKAEGCRSSATSIFASEMLIPDGALGTEFMTITTGRMPGKIFIAGRQSETIVVIEYTQASRKFYDLNSTSEFVQLELKPGPRRIQSSHPVQAILVMLDECIKGITVGDASMTSLMPMSVLYNDYFIGVPLHLNLKHFVAIITPEVGRDVLILNYILIKNVTWTPVIGADAWLFGEKPLTEWSSRVLSEYPFACYVYGMGNYMAYIHSAGYSSIKLMEDEFEGWLTHWESWHCPEEFSGGQKQQKRVCDAPVSSKYYNICRDEKMTTRWREDFCPRVTKTHANSNNTNSSNLSISGFDKAMPTQDESKYKKLIWVVACILVFLLAVGIFTFPYQAPKILSETHRSNTRIRIQHGMSPKGPKDATHATHVQHHWT